MKMKKLAYILLAIAMVFSISASSFAAGFWDVQSEHWAYDNIIKMQGKGVLGGFPDGSFRPDQPVTRAEFAKIMTTLYQVEKSADISFSDVSETDWFAAPVDTMATFMPSYVTLSQQMLFQPDMALSRVDAALSMLSFFDLPYDQADESHLAVFSDRGSMSVSEKKVVAAAMENGLMNGKNGYFDPKGSLTRAEISTLLARAFDKKYDPAVSQGQTDIKANTLHHPYGLSVGTYYIYFDCSNSCKPGDTDTPEKPEVPDNQPETPDVPDNKPEVPDNQPETPEVPDNKPEEDNSTGTASAFEKEVLDLVNQERAKNGLSPLVWANDLAAVARAHSQDMATNNFFSHTNLKGQSPFDRMKAAGIKYNMAAENIAAGQATPAEVMNSWMNSSGHRANILNPNLKELGVGYIQSDKGTSYRTYWTQVFASR